MIDAVKLKRDGEIMPVATINIQLDQVAAQIYRQASAKKRDQIQLLISSWLHELESTPVQQLMLASEAVLAKEWDTPEEDEIWAHL